jgi:hypothetical protein
MGGIARNDAELMLLLMQDFNQITKDTSDNILTQVEQSVETNVYEAYQPKKYQRIDGEGSFISSWISESLGYVPNEINYQVFSDPLKMAYNPENFQHGNDAVDRRGELAEDIAEGRGYDWPFYLHRDYWTPIVEWIESGEVDSVFEAMMTRRGVQWTKI